MYYNKYFGIMVLETSLTEQHLFRPFFLTIPTFYTKLKKSNYNIWNINGISR